MVTKVKQTSYLYRKNLGWFLSAYTGLSEVASSNRKSRDIRKLDFSWDKVRSAHFTAASDYKLNTALKI